MPMVIAAVIGLLVGGGIGAGVMASLGGKVGKKRAAAEHAAAAAKAHTPAAATASASASAAASAAPPEPAPIAKGSVAERAAKGDEAAKQQLESKPPEQRTSEETLGLAGARATAKLKDMTELKRKVVLLPKLVSADKTVLPRIREFANDREIGNDVLAMIASMPGPLGPDLLYSLANSPRANADTAKIAEELLYAKDVRSKASAALASLLDLKKATACEVAARALDKVKVSGDRRAVAPLTKMGDKKGCGEKKNQDCWPCLRKPDVLKDTMAEARKRAPPF